MKKTITLLILLFTLGLTANADRKHTPCPRENDAEALEKRIKTETKYMMGKLGLKENTEAGDYFIKTYAAYRNEFEEIFRSPELIPSVNEQGKRVRLTDKQIDKNNKIRFDHAEKMVKVRRKYYDRFRKYLSAKDMQTFYRYEKSMADKARSAMHKRKYRRTRTTKSTE